MQEQVLSGKTIAFSYLIDFSVLFRFLTLNGMERIRISIIIRQADKKTRHNGDGEVGESYVSRKSKRLLSTDHK